MQGVLAGAIDLPPWDCKEIADERSAHAGLSIGAIRLL